MKTLKNSIMILSLLFLFLVGIYLGNSVSYSLDNNDLLAEEYTSQNNTLFLEGIELNATSAKAGTKIDVNIKSSGASLDGGTINFVRTDGKYNISVNIKNIYEKPYIELPKYINTGDYIISSLQLMANNSNGATFSRNFTKNPKTSDDVLYDFNNKIRLESDPTNLDFELINSIKISTYDIKPGQRIPLEIDYNKDVRVIRLNFSLGNYTMYSYINSLARNPYIVLPQPTKIGTYELNDIYVETYNYGSVSYSIANGPDTRYLAYDSRYYVTSPSNSDEKVVYYNNAEITNDILGRIRSSNNIKQIELMSEDNSVVSQDVFAAINGLDKKLVVHYKDIEYTFDGNKIDREKAFNANVDYKLIDKNNEISKYVSDGLILEFAANGDLPGTAKVTIQKNSLFAKAFSQDHVNVYYYDEFNKKFELVKENLLISKDELEFEISHTSTYIVTNNKINNNSVVYSKSEQEEVKNKSETKTKNKALSVNGNNILLVIIIILGIVVLVLIVVLIRISNNKSVGDEKKNKTDKVEDNNTKDEIVEDEFSDFDEEDLRENISKANDSSFDEEDE